MAALQCHDEIRICQGCVGWLREASGVLDVTATLPVKDMTEAVAFCRAAGFTVRSYDDGFAFVHFNEVSVFDLGLEVDLDPNRNRAGCYIIVPDVDAWHTKLSAAALPVTPIEDQPWGMREFTLTDPSGNRLRIGHNAP